MATEIIVALITSGLGLVGIIITVAIGQRNTKKQLKESSDLTLYRIEQLEKKQDKHNTLIERMYKCEEQIEIIDTKTKALRYDVQELKSKVQ